MSKEILKRSFCLLLCCALMWGHVPVTGRAAEAKQEGVTFAAAAHTSHAVCGKSCTHEELHETVTYTRWTSGTFSSGSYYMGGDITLSRDLTITGDADICLNGYTLTFADGYWLKVEEGASLTICDCAGTGQVLRGPLETGSDGTMIMNLGTMLIGGGTFCPDGTGVNLLNAGTLTIYDGTFGIEIDNCAWTGSSSNKLYGTATIYHATVRAEKYDRAVAVTNEQKCTLTIYDGDFASKANALRNMGTADIQGGSFSHLLDETFIAYDVIYNEGTLDLRDATVTAKTGYAIKNGGYWNSNNTKYTHGRVNIYDGTTIIGEKTRWAAIYNTGSVYVYGGDISGHVGIENRSARAPETGYDGGISYISGGSVDGTKCAVLNSGSTTTKYQNGVPVAKLFSRGILDITGSPALGKVILEYPKSIVIRSTCTIVVDVEVEFGDIVLGDTISQDSAKRIYSMDLLNPGYILLYDSSKGIYLETDHCGATANDDLHWKIDKNGKLTIFGTGRMEDHPVSSYQPWNKSRTGVEITEVIFEPGITHIGSSSFAYLPGLTKIVIPEGVTTISTWVFEGCDDLEEVYLPSTLTSIGRCFFATIDGTQPPEAVYYNGCEHQWANVAVDKTQPAPVVPICIPNENTDDGDCTTEVACSVCNGVAVPAAESHTGGTANCTEKAECAVCGMAYGELAHQAVVDEAVEADCENTGLTEGQHCELCGKVLIEQETVAATGHSYEAVVTDPTCEEGGYTTYTCYCGDSYTGDEVAALGHDMGNWETTLEATCMDEGEERRDCSRCDHFETRQIPEKGHEHEAVVTDPTCEDPGYTTYTCHCGDSYTGDEVAALGHDMGDWEIVREASCTEAGEKQKTCGRCDHTESQQIPAAGHDFEDGYCVGCQMKEPAKVIRLAGANRFETSLLVADRMKEVLGVEKFDAIIVACGSNFADALAGSYLSAVKGAPILLSWGSGGRYAYLDDNNIAYIKANLKPGGTVYLLGGINAVPELYDAALRDLQVKRLGGKDRFATNLLILKEAGVRPGQEILVCTATEFADSLSASATGLPILLAYDQRGSLYGDQPSYLESLDGKNTFCIVGGKNAVCQELEKELGQYGATTRLAGADRLRTSVMVAEKYFPEAASVAIAYGWDYPDGLCGGALAYSMGSPLVLSYSVPKYYAVARDYLARNEIDSGIILGGEKLITEEAARDIFAMSDEDEILIK